MDVSTSEAPKRRLVFMVKPPEAEDDQQALAEELAQHLWDELHPSDPEPEEPSTPTAPSHHPVVHRTVAL